jgi:GT2 family glycosyltransferase
MAVDVTVSIVNHEHREAVLESLRALEDDDGRRARVEVIVVDNVSQDGSPGAIREAFPGVHVIARAQRAGYGANHNAALAVARGRHALLLNDDTRVLPGAIDRLCAALDADAQVAVAAPCVRTPAGTVEPTLWPRPSLRVDVLGALRREAPPVADGEAIGWAMGCALMVRTDAIRAVGGFDEAFFMYSEEIDLCTRLVDAGGRIASVPDAVVVHDGQASTGLESPERAVEMARSRRRYWHKHYGLPARLAAEAIVGAQFAAMALLRARGDRARARPLLLQAAVSLTGRPSRGLRERAEAFNRSRVRP